LNSDTGVQVRIGIQESKYTDMRISTGRVVLVRPQGLPLIATLVVLVHSEGVDAEGKAVAARAQEKGVGRRAGDERWWCERVSARVSGCECESE
jgi:hypothetical protein